MTPIEGGHSNDWERLCTGRELWFRAICNGVIDPARRPIKVRVIDRLVRLPDARRLYSQIWEAVQSRPDREVEFYRALSDSPLWSTLVSEAAAGERRWGDLLNGTDKGGVIDYVKSVFDKTTDAEAHPATRRVVMVASVVVPLLGAQAAFPDHYKQLLVPIQTLIVGDRTVKLQVQVLSPETTEIPVRLSGTGIPATFPVNFKVTSTASRRDIDIVVRPAGNSDAHNTQTIADAMTSISSNLGVLTKASELNGSRTRQDVAAIRAGLDNMTVATEHSAERIGTTVHVGIQSTVIPMTAAQADRVTFGTIVTCVSKFGQDNRGKWVQLGTSKERSGHECEPGNQKLVHEGDSQAAEDWTLTVNSISEPWFGPDSAAVTIHPNALTLPAGGISVDQSTTAASPQQSAAAVN